jgi:uncharacterized protein GlcG (DUF336 family)
MFKVIVGVLLAAAAACANAQAYGLPITLEQARKVLAAGEAEARKNNLTMGIAIVDSGGHLVLFQRMDGAQFVSENVAREKAWAAAAYKRPGKAFMDRLAKGGEDLLILQLHGVVAADGGEPIIVDGKLIGAIGVSGSSAANDGLVARAGTAALK